MIAVCQSYEILNLSNLSNLRGGDRRLKVGIYLNYKNYKNYKCTNNTAPTQEAMQWG